VVIDVSAGTVVRGLAQRDESCPARIGLDAASFQ
jgi:hypothetical protein